MGARRDRSYARRLGHLVNDELIIPLKWRTRDVPLSPGAVLAADRTAYSLCRRLLDENDSALERLQGCAGRALVLLTGETEDLPWVDGAIYLGRDPRAPRLYL